MDERQTLSGRTKKLLALLAVGIVLVGAVAGMLWPASGSENSPAGPKTGDSGDGSEPTPEPEAELAGEEADQQLVTDNDRLLTETYGLELPVSVRAREIILETHELLGDFERVQEELREFADKTRYSCQHLSDAFDPLGSGPGGEIEEIGLRISESDIGLEISGGLAGQNGRVVIAGDLSDLQLNEITVITGMVQRFNDIADDSQDYGARLVECGLADDSSDSQLEVGAADLNRLYDIGIIAEGVNQYISSQNLLPANRIDIAPLLGAMSNYSLDQINAAGSWDGANLPADGDFAWNESYSNPPDPQSVMGREGSYDNVVIIGGARCDDQDQLPVEGSGRRAVIIYRLKDQSGTVCFDI